MAEDRNNNNTLIGLALIGLALGFGVLLLAWFFAELLASNAGERAAAFGAVSQRDDCADRSLPRHVGGTFLAFMASGHPPPPVQG
jgi:hypothetical protein